MNESNGPEKKEAAPIWQLTLFGEVSLLHSESRTIIDKFPEGARNLLVYLALHPGQQLSRSDIAGELWPPDSLPSKPHRHSKKQIQSEHKDPIGNDVSHGKTTNAARADQSLRTALKELRSILEDETKGIRRQDVIEATYGYLCLKRSLWCDYTEATKLYDKWRLPRLSMAKKQEIAEQIWDLAGQKPLAPIGVQWIEKLTTDWQEICDEVYSVCDLSGKVAAIDAEHLHPSPPQTNSLGESKRHLLRRPCFGRTEELANLRQYWADSTTRIVCLYGMGGIGKSTLAEAFRWHLAKENREQVKTALVRLTGQTTIAGATRVIAKEWGLTEKEFAAGNDSLHLLGRTLFPGQYALTILDGVDDLLAHDLGQELIDAIEEIMGACQNSFILITSQSAIVHPFIVNIPVHALELPGANSNPLDPPPTEQELAQNPAVQLYLEARMRRRPRKVSLKEVAELCNYLEGIPLAIELAAYSLLSPRQIIQVPARKIRSQSLANRRHRSIQAVLDAMWANLSPHARNLALELSVLHGPWTIGALQAIAPATDQLGQAELLNELVDKSFVLLNPSYSPEDSENEDGENEVAPADEEEFYLISEVIREYLAERLTVANTSEMYEALRQRHAEYYRSWAGRMFYEREKSGWLGRFHRESQNLWRALAYFESIAPGNPSALLKAMDVCNQSNQYLFSKGMYWEGTERNARIAAIQVGEQPEDESVFRSLQSKRSDLYHAGMMFGYVLGKLAACIELGQAAQQIRASLGLANTQAFAITSDLLLNAKIELCMDEELPGLIEKIDQELKRREVTEELRELIPDLWLIKVRCYNFSGQHELAYQAAALAREAYDHYYNTPHPRILAPILGGLLSGAVETGLIDEARKTLGELLSIVYDGTSGSQVEDMRMLLSSVEHAIDLLTRLGDGQHAARLFHVTEHWRRKLKRDYFPRAVKERERRRQLILELIDRELMDAEQIRAENSTTDEIATFLHNISTNTL